MKRSGREGRWAGGLPPPQIRFAAEAVFLILVAAGAALAQLSPLAIIGLMLVAWLLVALIERASSREQARAFAGAEESDNEELPEAEPAHEVEVPAEASAAEPGRQVAYRWLFWRRERATTELEAPTAALEERPSRAHVRKIEAEVPPPAIEIETIVAEIVDTEEPQPGPAVTKRPLELPGLEEPVPARVAATPPTPKAPPREPLVEAPFAEAPLPPVEAPPVAPVAEAPHEQAPPPPPAPPAPLGPPREWNIWELESLAREQAGDPARDEEWSALFMFLREHANADGVLPIQFDDLVRESFSELIQAA